jgi:hypothetical protein
LHEIHSSLLQCPDLELRAGCGQWVRTEPVWAVRAFRAVPDDQHDGADERYKRQQDPPAGAVDVMQPPHRDREARQKSGKAEEWVSHRNPQRTVDDRGDEHANDREQHPVLIFRSDGAIRELHVVRKSRRNRLDKIHSSLLQCPDLELRAGCRQLVRAEPVGTVRTDDRNQAEKYPPAGAVEIVKPPDRDGNIRQQRRQTEQTRRHLGADRPINDAGDDVTENDEQDPIPILGPDRPTRKVHIVRKSRRNRLHEIHNGPLACLVPARP